jgi:hypothetical protein
MDFTIAAIDDETADAIRADVAAGRLPAEPQVLTEPGGPCRQCLRPGEVGDELLLFTYQPFRGESRYTVPSPAYLHAEPCTSYADDAVPAFVRLGGLRAIRSYNAGHAIHDGEVVPGSDVEATIARLLKDDTAEYVHVHCATAGCFTFRADRR